MAKTDTKAENLPICGIVMPISGIPPYDAGHWQEVRLILDRAISSAEMQPRPVWEGGAADIIHDRIIRNLFENDLVVCDVSGLNPNVMLELGIRLSFGKPTILITDDVGTVPFDTKMIDHLQYPTGLHLLQTEHFMEQLKLKILDIMSAVEAQTYRPFIKNFGHLEPGSLGTDKDSADIILSRLDSLSADVRQLQQPARSGALNALLGSSGPGAPYFTIKLKIVRKDMSRAQATLSAVKGIHRMITLDSTTLAVLLRSDVLWQRTQEVISAALSEAKIEFALVDARLQSLSEALG